jgi:hypothetical protein
MMHGFEAGAQACFAKVDEGLGSSLLEEADEDDGREMETVICHRLKATSLNNDNRSVYGISSFRILVRI